MVRVRAERKPDRWVPPSALKTVLVNARTFSLCRRATAGDGDLLRPPRCPRVRKIGLVERWSWPVEVLDELRDTALVDELVLLAAALVEEPDYKTRLRNASSRRRCHEQVVSELRSRRL